MAWYDASLYALAALTHLSSPKHDAHISVANGRTGGHELMIEDGVNSLFGGTASTKPNPCC